MIKRTDLKHKKWQLINQQGLTPEQADERIKEIRAAEHKKYVCVWCKENFKYRNNLKIHLKDCSYAKMEQVK